MTHTKEEIQTKIDSYPEVLKLREQRKTLIELLSKKSAQNSELLEALKELVSICKHTNINPHSIIKAEQAIKKAESK